LAAATVLPALIAWAAIALLRRSPLATRLADHPNERSLHAVATPRLGGIGIMLAVLPFGLMLAAEPLPLILACALALSLLSLADDVRSLPVQIRLTAHGAAALVVATTWPAMASTTALHWAACAFGVLAIMWTTNLYNFMDGSDGLAAVMAIAGFGCYALAATMAGNLPLAFICAALASASAGFLAHNFPPARVFLGDAGSIPLGFLAAALGLEGFVTGTWPLAFPLLVFSPFIADATVTLARRALRRETLWRAHRSHHYQRLVLAGWSRRRLLAWSAVLMAASAASALVLARSSLMLQCGIILAWVVVYALSFLAIERRITRTAGTTP
jgi:UDP-N-acetylmuramyl pentapeptide phosphotransferase/UDP-N-acetylglucosamine-1-phosphate transferase